MADNADNSVPQPTVVVDEEKQLKLDYGFVILKKIFNESSNTVHFKNPYFPSESGYTEGDIAPRESEDKLCYGNIPYYNAPRKYEVRYYNSTLRDYFTIHIKDLGGDWLVSFIHGDNLEHTTDILPGIRVVSAAFFLYIYDNGFEIQQLGLDDEGTPTSPVYDKGGVMFWPQ